MVNLTLEYGYTGKNEMTFVRVSYGAGFVKVKQIHEKSRFMMNEPGLR